MPELLTSLPLDGWKLSELKPFKAMMLANLTHSGNRQVVRLADSIELRIPFTPSCFNSASSERKGCLISIPQAIVEYIHKLEDDVKAHLSIPHSVWISSLRHSEGFAPCLRCKVNTAQVEYFDAEKVACDAPTEWRQLLVNACVAIRGVYLQKTSAGLLIDITALQYGERTRKPPF